jgi:WhiB family redox-sensing transcriptional regulator
VVAVTTAGELGVPTLLHVAELVGADAVALTRHEWRARAACRGADPELFFPERGASLEPALSYCRSCPVRVECLQYAVERPANTVLGIWGGRAARARRKACRRRLSAAEVLALLEDR